MNKDKRNNIQLLGTLNNADESGIIANANQVYDANEDKSTQDVSKEHTERIETLETKESSMQTTLENITKTGEASAASNVTYNHSDSKLDATNVQQAIDEVRKKSNYNDGENIIDFNTIHLITDNPEYICVAVDADEKILYGIKVDGQPYFGVGCPQQVKDYIDEQINKILGTNDITTTIDSLKEIEAFLKDFTNSDTLKKLLDTKANKTDVDSSIAGISADIADKYKKSNPNDSEGNVVDTNTIFSIKDNPEYIKALTDSVGKLIEAIGIDGVRKFFAGINIQGISQCVIDNPDYTIAWVDNTNKIIFAIQHDGNPYFGYGVPKQIKTVIDNLNTDLVNKYTEIKQSISDTNEHLSETATNINKHISDTENDVDKKINLGNNVYPSNVHEVSEFEDNTSVLLDNLNHILESIGSDGVRNFFAGINVKGNKFTTTDNPEYKAVLLDKDNKILIGIKNDGDVYFAAGVPKQVADVAKIGMECNNQSAEIDSLNIVHGLEIKKNKGCYLKATEFGENYDADSYTSDYIKIDNNARYFYTGMFGGACAGAQFFSDIDVFISAWTDSTLSPRTDVPVPVPSNAKYIRFSSFRRDFSISSTKHFLSIDNFDINPIFNELTIDRDIDFINGLFDIFIYKVRYNSTTNVYTNGIMVRYKLNSATIWQLYLVKDYNTQKEAAACLKELSEYTLAFNSDSHHQYPISYSINWDKVTSTGITRFDNIHLNPDFVKPNTRYDDAVSKGTRNIKNILWLGTSIPAGGYPEMVGAILGCKVYNEAVGESLCRLGWGAGCIKEGDTIDIWGCDINTHVANPASNTITALAKSLSASKAEKQYLLDNLAHFEEVTQTTLNRTKYTDDVIMSFSYEDKILKYVDSSRNDYTPVDLIVFDHGHNDIVPDGVPAWDTYSLTNTNKDNYWGAMNFLLDVIKKYQPNIAICQVSHYYGLENYTTGSGIVEKIWDAQKQIADYNGMVFCPLYKLTGYSSRRMLRTNGYWSQGGIWHDNGFSYVINQDGTISTNSYTIAKLYNLDGTWNNQIFTSNGQNIPSIVSGREIEQKSGEIDVNYNIWPLEAAFPDRLHPHSDTSTKALKKIATLLAGWLKGTYCM